MVRVGVVHAHDFETTLVGVLFDASVITGVHLIPIPGSPLAVIPYPKSLHNCPNGGPALGGSEEEPTDFIRVPFLRMD